VVHDTHSLPSLQRCLPSQGPSKGKDQGYVAFVLHACVYVRQFDLCTSLHTLHCQPVRSQQASSFSTPCYRVCAGTLCACKRRSRFITHILSRQSLQSHCQLVFWPLVCGQVCIVFWAPVLVLEVLSCWCSSEACSAAKGTAAAETKGAAAAKAQGAGTKTSTAASGEPTHV